MNWEFYAKKALETRPYLASEDEITADNKETVTEAKAFKDKWGFDFSETWDLDRTIAAFILPRLAYFRYNIAGVPNSYIKFDAEMQPTNTKEATKLWEKDLDKMLLAFSLILDDEFITRPEEKDNQINEGLKLFATHFEDLWN